MLRLLRLSLRFLLPLVLAMAALAAVVVPLVDGLTLRWFMRDLDARAVLVGATLEEPLVQALARRAAHEGDGGAANARIDAMFGRAIADERLYALGVCDLRGELIRATSTLPASVTCAQAQPLDRGQLVRLPSGSLHVAAAELRGAAGAAGLLLVVHDMSFVDRRSRETRNYVIALFAVLGVAVGLIALLVAHLSWRGWVAGLKAMLRGEGVIRPFSRPSPELQPLVGELRAFVRDMQREQRSQVDTTTQWNPQSLRRLLREQLSGDEILLVSNREPYIHVNSAGGVRVQQPASGLVTGVEPVMRACSGTWIAHGAGSADRATVDARDHVAVPPDNPSYTLRRIWLTKEEESGYYYGFANEGLWPLCHLAHVRPVFRTEDWEQYRRVNQRFAEAVVAEARTDNPVVLIQDYHFALLPRMVRDRLPKATIITFWHIPWPNSESFGICPWRDEIVDGLLGSTILGFHTRYHCNNFLQTVDRFLETRIEYETSTVSFGGHLTQVESYPISIAWPAPDELQPPVAECRRAVRKELGIGAESLFGLGVDRLDYTKGIVERLRAVERLLKLYPQWVGHFVFMQIAAPSRSSLDEYQRFESQVRATAARINARFGTAQYQPILLAIEHHDHASVIRHYRATDVCLVTSLHDGMNLVAKEYVAARDDEQGVLVLSQFAGAAHELHEALIVNPYHTDQVAEALHRGLSMPAEEQRERMRSLRQVVREFNVYRWAGRMLLDAARLRRRERIAARIEGHNGDG